MASIVLVSGNPGSGKTTLARSLASDDAKGIHLVSDRFYEFFPSLIPPTDLASKDQNTAIMHALAAAARSFAGHGYHVYLDGVIGPWFLSVFETECAGLPLHYVVLRSPEDLSVKRVRDRDGVGASAGVVQMVGAFRDLGRYTRHAVETGTMAPEQVLGVVAAGLAAGNYALEV